MNRAFRWCSLAPLFTRLQRALGGRLTGAPIVRLVWLAFGSGCGMRFTTDVVFG